MTVFESGGDLILVDAGLTFPKAEMHGIDLVLPDFSYVVDRADRLRAIVLTHGHEDHVGALPYLLRETGTGPVVFGTRLTLGLIKSKLDEHGLGADTELRELTPDGSRVQAGPFEVEAVRVTHSIPDAVALVLYTAHGAILHTGDFKLDLTPVDGRPIDVDRLRALGDAGVAVLMSDSTNAENPGTTPSEMTVGPSMREIIGRRSRSRDRDVVRIADPPSAAGDRRGLRERPQGLHNRPVDGAERQHLAEPRLRGRRRGPAAEAARPRLGAAARGGRAVHGQPGRAAIGPDAYGARRSSRAAGAPDRHGGDVVQGRARERGERGGDGEPAEPDGRNRADREQLLRPRLRPWLCGRAAGDAGDGAAASLHADPRRVPDAARARADRRGGWGAARTPFASPTTARCSSWTATACSWPGRSRPA